MNQELQTAKVAVQDQISVLTHVLNKLQAALAAMGGVIDAGTTDEVDVEIRVDDPAAISMQKIEDAIGSGSFPPIFPEKKKKGWPKGKKRK